jgi:hypothetical protein
VQAATGEMRLAHDTYTGRLRYRIDAASQQRMIIYARALGCIRL